MLSYMEQQQGTQTAMVSVRMPVDLRARLQQQARQNHRTLSGEILHILERALQDQPQPEAPASHS
jgi:predicted DNA-binding protein